MIEQTRWGFLQIVLVYLGILVIGLFYGWLGTEPINFVVEQLDMGLIGEFFMGFLVQFAATVGLVYLLAIYIPRGQWSDLGLMHRPAHVYIKYGIWGGTCLIVMIMLLSIPLNYFQPELEPQYFEEVLRSAASFPDYFVIFLVGSVLGPFSEELFYRGMIYPVFRKHLGPLWGAILAGILFGLVHWDIWRAIPLAIGGIGLCYLYEKSNSILVTTVAHGVWNGFMFLMVFISMNQGFLT